MANVFDLGLLSQFSDIFAWVLIFAVMFGILQVTNPFKNQGINALVAVSITVLLGTTSGTTTVITNFLPWFFITGIFMVFFFVLLNFIGVPLQETVLSGGGGMWWVFTPLIIGLIIALVAGGQFSKSDPGVEPTPGQAVLNLITEPKILGFILIMVIASITVALMAGVPGIPK